MIDRGPSVGLLLTGGASRRLGTAKASLVIDGETLANRVATRLTAVTDLALEVGPGFSALTAVREVPPGAGPLAALLAGVDAATIALGREPDLVLLVACDLPNVDEALLTTLRDAPGAPTVVPQAAGRLQFACARYGTDAVTAARAAWSAGERSLRAVFDLVPYDVLEVPDALLADVDTPADCARFGIARPG